MKITNATGAWQSTTVSENEIWQVHDGVLLVDNDSTEGDRLGIQLSAGGRVSGIQWKTAGTVYYRLSAGSSALIARVIP